MRAQPALLLPVLAFLLPLAASAQERCLLAEVRLDASIVNDIRPYLVCGMLQGRDGHFTVVLDGQAASIRGGGPDSCNRVRLDAFDRADARLLSAIPEIQARRAHIASEFEKADEFLRVAARSEDLAVNSPLETANCRFADGVTLPAPGVPVDLPKVDDAED